MLILSPHLDDAVFSAHSILDGARVVTVCAGIPPIDTRPTQFDVQAGFESGAEAMIVRQVEDKKAAEMVGFTVQHGDVLDAGYGGRPEQIERKVEALLAHVTEEVVVIPLGLRHPDHEAVSRAAIGAKVKNLWAYEDLPYAYVWCDQLAPAFHRIGGVVESLTILSRPDKRKAVETYASQISDATHMDAILAPERFHRLNGTRRLT